MEATSPSLVTHGIRISVQSLFVPEQSSSDNQSHVFAYRIQIENESNDTVQLISRYWDITDGWGEHRTVTGEGVVGKQPVLLPGQSHNYVSGCVFRTPLGRMRGHYIMRRIADGQEFQVEIPAFLLTAPFLKN